TVDAFTAAERFDNGLRAHLTIKGGAVAQHTMQQTAPGRYEVQLPLNEYGTFSLHAEYSRELEGGELQRVGDSHGYVSNPYPVEYQSFEPDAAKLELAAQTTRGALLSDVNAVFDPRGESVRHQTELWPKAILLALGLFFLDLLVRRVRIFDRDFRATSAA